MGTKENVMATKVAGALRDGLFAQLFEVEKQIRHPRGYPFNPALLREHLQIAIEGRFTGHSPPLLTLVRTFKPADIRPGIVLVDEVFKERFDGVEKDKYSAELAIHRIRRSAQDIEIRGFLSVGREWPEVLLGDFLSALSDKERRRDHTRLMAFIRNRKSNLRMVNASHVSCGAFTTDWVIGTFPLGNLPRDAGGQVLSCNQQVT